MLSRCPVEPTRSPSPSPAAAHLASGPHVSGVGGLHVARGSQEDLRPDTGKPGLLLTGQNRFLSITFKSSLYGIKKKYKVPINRLETTFV